MKITLKGIGSTNLLVKQPVSHLYNTHTYMHIYTDTYITLLEITALFLLTVVPTASGIVTLLIVLLFSGMQWPIVCLQRPGLARGRAEGTLPPLVQTLSLYIDHENRLGKALTSVLALVLSPCIKISLPHGSAW